MASSTTPPKQLSDATSKGATGKTLTQWFALIDAQGGPALGRSVIGKFLLNDHKLDMWWATTVTVEYERARGVVEKDGLPKGYSICSTKTLSVPTDQAYAAFHRDQALHRDSLSKATPGKVLRFPWPDGNTGAGSQVEILIQPKAEKSGIVVNHTRIQSRNDADALRSMWEARLTAIKATVG